MGNRVYDISKFVNEHPGGPDVLMDVAGAEATEEFEATFHSKKARLMCKEYLIGKVKGAELGDLFKAVSGGGGDDDGNTTVYIVLALVVAALAYYYKIKNA